MTEDEIDALVRAKSAKLMEDFGFCAPEMMVIHTRKRMHELVADFALKPKWIKFDQDDSSTWPGEYGRIWVYSHNHIVMDILWQGGIKALGQWVLYWTPDIRPEPPMEEES